MANKNGGNDEPNTGIAIALMIGLLVLFWFIFHDPIAKLFLSIGLGLIQPLKWTVGIFQPELFSGIEEHFRLTMGGYRLKDVSISVLFDVSSWAGSYYRWLLAPLMAFLAYRAWKHPIVGLQTSHTYESLIAYQSQYWKPIVPVCNLKLVDDTSEAWLPSRRCLDIAKANGLIHAHMLKLEETWELLETQLGDRFSLNRLKDHERALFAVFAARICRDKKEAAALLDNLNESCRKTGFPDYSVAHAAFAKYRSDKRVKEKIRGFGYSRTVLFQMLIDARAFDGKLATSNFIWLKPVDRILWYALDRAPVDGGRFQVAAFAEAIAITSQWQAESLAVKNKMRMGVTHDDPDKELYRVTIPYLVTALTAFVIDIEDCGEVEYPQTIASIIQTKTDERVRFDIIKNKYVVNGLAGYFAERLKRAKEQAAPKKTEKLQGEI